MAAVSAMSAAPDKRAAPAATAAGSVRVLGLDPGSRRTGFGIIECRGSDCVHVAHGCIAVDGEEFAGRLRTIFERLQALICEHSPAEVAVERVFMSRNADSALKLGQARGAALCAVPQGLPVFEYAPRAIKLALVGSGAAEKPQVAHMIRALLGIQGRLVADASDALAVAVCHAHSRRMSQFVPSNVRPLVK
ncbi:MAG TPA: crossover junction endodeoxyribonuclease RuvC [Steroidobacteraceae bacterium]|nr:crossover junction endodeoxyribonuclease RuvC [Steroidobacteraceae bacterium]